MTTQTGKQEMPAETDKVDQSELIKALANDIACLKGRTPEELAEYWCILNRWEWPEQIPNPEPVPVAIKDRETPRRSAIMAHIESMVAHKFISRTWNKKQMTDEEHSVWYAKTFGG